MVVITTTETSRLRHLLPETETETSSAVEALALPIVTDVILLHGAHLHLISDRGGGVLGAVLDPMTGDESLALFDFAFSMYLKLIELYSSYNYEN